MQDKHALDAAGEGDGGSLAPGTTESGDAHVHNVTRAGEAALNSQEANSDSDNEGSMEGAQLAVMCAGKVNMLNVCTLQHFAP